MSRRSIVSSLIAAALVALAPLHAQTASAPPVIRPNDALTAEGIPPIAAQIAEAVGRYTELRSASILSWHPVRRELLIATRFGDTPQVHEVRVPGGARRQLTFFPDRVQSARWPRRSADYFVFTKDRGGDEFGQLYRYDIATGSITLISDGGRSQNGIGPWSRDGDRLAVSSTRRNGRDRDVYVMDPRDPASARLVLQVEGGGWSVADWSPDDRQLAVVEGLSVNESYIWIVDAKSGEKKLLTAKGGAEKVVYDGCRFSADGRGVYTTTDRGSEFKRLTWVDLATGAHTPLTADIPWDVEGFVLSPDGKTIAFETNEEGLSVLHLLDTASRKELPVPRLPAGIVGGAQWHNDSRNLAFSLASARSPFDVWSLDVQAGKLERWTESETGGLNAAAFAEPELVRWKSFDGRTISGFLYKPPTGFTGSRPVIVDIHGGPEGQSRPGFIGRNNYLVQELGVAILYPNVRGSLGFGKTFSLLDNGLKREDSVRDVGALLDWIGTRPDLDAQRIMVTGGSYGGYMTLAVATHYDARIRCSLDVVGISNFVTFLQNTESYRRDLRRAEYGDEREPAMREFLLKIAPMNNAQKITKPLFVVQGRNDPRVPYTESEQMVATVEKNGGPVWYLLAADEGHGFGKKKNQDYQFYATVAFIREYLLK